MPPKLVRAIHAGRRSKCCKLRIAAAERDDGAVYGQNQGFRALAHSLAAHVHEIASNVKMAASESVPKQDVSLRATPKLICRNFLKTKDIAIRSYKYTFS
jgi:hypothetical protein